MGEQKSRVGRLHRAPGLFEVRAEAAALGELLLHAKRRLRSVLAGHCLREDSFRRREAVLGLLELEPILAVVKGRKHRPLRDDIADAGMQVLDGAGNLAADDDLIARFQDAGCADDVAHGAMQEGGERDVLVGEDGVLRPGETPVGCRREGRRDCDEQESPFHDLEPRGTVDDAGAKGIHLIIRTSALGLFRRTRRRRKCPPRLTTFRASATSWGFSETSASPERSARSLRPTDRGAGIVSEGDFALYLSPSFRGRMGRSPAWPRRRRPSRNWPLLSVPHVLPRGVGFVRPAFGPGCRS